jgi:hypothetical protein
MEEQDPLTGSVIGAAIEVHRIMGPGLLESVYQACMEEELRLRGIVFQAQVLMPLVYKGKQLKDPFKMDLFFPRRAGCRPEGGGQVTCCVSSSTAHLPSPEQYPCRFTH